MCQVRGAFFAPRWSPPPPRLAAARGVRLTPRLLCYARRLRAAASAHVSGPGEPRRDPRDLRPPGAGITPGGSGPRRAALAGRRPASDEACSLSKGLLDEEDSAAPVLWVHSHMDWTKRVYCCI